MDPRFSLKVYPRKDVAFKAKSSYNFETIRASVYLKRDTSRMQDFNRWVIHGIIGLIVGVIAFMMAIMEENLAGLRSEITQEMLNEGYNMQKVWAFYAFSGVFFALIAVLLTVYVGPYAAGSGVPEVMGLLNGVNLSGATDIATLIIKIVGVVLAVVGGLCVGKEGPLVHIGAIVGLLVPYLPFESFKNFQNDSDKRTFLSAGSSAGVAAAFGAPIGGALFTYEISKPNTFWTFSMLWRVFFTAAVSTFTLGFLQALQTGGVLSLSDAAALKFGNVNIVYSPLSDAIIAIVIGVICGLLGALFVSVYGHLGVFRKKHINTNFKKIVEVVLFSLVTGTIFFWLAAADSKCIPETELFDEYYRFTCPQGTFNRQATLFFNTEGGTIRALMNQEVTGDFWQLAVFALAWYLMTITTAGVQVPSGLFLPGMIIGCALGQIINQTVKDVVGVGNPVAGQSYQIMGATAMLAGYTRQTYSLSVIMLETTQQINFFMPLLLCVLVSVGVASIFNRSLYDRALRMKQIPLLRNHVPKSQSEITAYQIMSSPVLTVEGIISVEYLKDILQKPFSTYPVLNSAGNIVGVIPKNFLIVLVENHHWVNLRRLTMQQKQKLTKMYSTLESMRNNPEMRSLAVS